MKSSLRIHKHVCMYDTHMQVIASFNYAQKKTSKSITIALSALEGAAIMNNTFVLGIFMFLIYSQGLAWEYCAETISVMFVQIAVALMAFRKKQTFFDAYCILALYPISLAIVFVLESWGWD